MKNKVISLYDYTGVAVTPWAEAGYECWCYDIQHDSEQVKRVEFDGGGSINYAHADLYSKLTLLRLYATFAGEVAFAQAFPVCTDLAVSGAAHFQRKRKVNPDFQNEAAMHARWCASFFNELGCAYYIENPISVLSTLWRKPNYRFHPYEFGGYIAEEEAEHPLYPEYIAPRDAYTKRTCLWTNDKFIMPELKPVDCETFGNSRQHRKLGGKSAKTKNIRSATPRGFAQAVFECNSRQEVELDFTSLELVLEETGGNKA